MGPDRDLKLLEECPRPHELKCVHFKEIAAKNFLLVGQEELKSSMHKTSIEDKVSYNYLALIVHIYPDCVNIRNVDFEVNLDMHMNTVARSKKGMNT